MRELKLHSEAGFRVTRVAEEAGCVVSVLYHHFENREGLIDAALIEIMRIESAGMEAIFQVIPSILDKVTTVEESIEAYIRATHGTLGAVKRALDAQILTAIQSRPEVRQVWEEHSKKEQHATELLLTAMVQRGLIDPALDIPALALMLRGLNLSRLLEEYVDQPAVEFERWVALMRLLAQRVLAPH